MTQNSEEWKGDKMKRKKTLQEMEKHKWLEEMFTEVTLAKKKDGLLSNKTTVYSTRDRAKSTVW